MNVENKVNHLNNLSGIDTPSSFEPNKVVNKKRKLKGLATQIGIGVLFTGILITNIPLMTKKNPIEKKKMQSTIEQQKEHVKHRCNKKRIKERRQKRQANQNQRSQPRR